MRHSRIVDARRRFSRYRFRWLAVLTGLALVVPPGVARADTTVPFAVPAVGPVMEAGFVSNLTASGALSGVSSGSTGLGGVTVVDGAAFVIDGTRVVRVDKATGATSVLAGSAGSTSCQDASTGAAARFAASSGGVRMGGSDGRFVYVSDKCGLRRVDPGTGATSTVTSTWYRWMSVAGQMLYGVDMYNMIWRHDLATVNPPTRVSNASVSPSGAIAADASNLWMINGYGYELYRFDLATGARTTITTGLPANQPASAMLSVGGYLYASLRSTAAPYGYTTLARITKATGRWRTVTGMDSAGNTDGGYVHAQFSSISGIAADGPNLLISDSSTTQSYLRITRAPETVFSDVLFVPENNPVNQNSAYVNGLLVEVRGWSGPILVWNPETHLCTSYCQDIYQWRQLTYEQAGPYSFWHAFWCTVGECLPEDYERDLIIQMIEVQGIFNLDGTLRADKIAEDLVGTCWEFAAKPSTDCSATVVTQAAEGMDSHAQLAADMAAFLVGRPSGTRPNLTAEQQAAKSRFEELARKACAENPRLVGESSQMWGSRVHARFNELVRAEGNPKMFGETGYLNRQVIPKGTNEPGGSFPDAVYGASHLQPEMLFDLKTGFKGIEKWWVERLAGNLPIGHTNIPVFRLGC